MFIDVERASIRYRDLHVFEDFTASFASNQITALVGPSGSGKSSLLSAMGGGTRLHAGSITFRNHDGFSFHPDVNLIAWVPQNASTLSTRTALDNVMVAGLSRGLSLDAASANANACLEDVGLADRTFHLAKELSGGELQRVAFARALATKKPLILADEPSSSLDAQNTELLGELLRSLRGRTTIVVATHDPIIMAAAECIIEIRKNR